MKDEMGGKVITEFVGLRSKMYSVLLQNQKVKKQPKDSLEICRKISVTIIIYNALMMMTT